MYRVDVTNQLYNLQSDPETGSDITNEGVSVQAGTYLKVEEHINHVNATWIDTTKAKICDRLQLLGYEEE